jgi:cytidylyltransferase family
MLARIISTLALWAITVLAIVYCGAAGWSLLLAALAGGALWESCILLEKIGLKPMKVSAQIISLAIFAASWAFPYFGLLNVAGGSLVFACSAALIIIPIVKYPYGDFAAKTAIPTIAAIFAVPFMLQWLSVLGVEARTEESQFTGIVLAIWILAAAKFSDVGAYVLGAAFGRRKMSPDISPNKTWEGAIGGLCSSAIVSAIIAWGCAPVLPSSFTPILAATMGVIIGAVAIISDLLESVLKRKADIKDSGRFIPGIGGALDLADSLLLSAPIGALMLSIIL